MDNSNYCMPQKFIKVNREHQYLTNKEVCAICARCAQQRCNKTTYLCYCCMNIHKQMKSEGENVGLTLCTECHEDPINNQFYCDENGLIHTSSHCQTCENCMCFEE